MKFYFKITKIFASLETLLNEVVESTASTTPNTTKQNHPKYNQGVQTNRKSAYCTSSTHQMAASPLVKSASSMPFYSSSTQTMGTGSCNATRSCNYRAANGESSSNSLNRHLASTQSAAASNGHHHHHQLHKSSTSTLNGLNSSNSGGGGGNRQQAGMSMPHFQITINSNSNKPMTNLNEQKKIRQ
jgi:hypothetical protein